MTATNHAVTGVLVAVAIREPALALPAAFFSHFILDMIPHWNHKFKNHTLFQISVIADLLLASGITLVLMLTINAPGWLIFGGSFLGMLPDVLWIDEFNRPEVSREKSKSFLSRLKWLLHKIQWSETSWGFFVELAWLLLTLLLLFNNYSK